MMEALNDAGPRENPPSFEWNVIDYERVRKSDSSQFSRKDNQLPYLEYCELALAHIKSLMTSIPRRSANVVLISGSRCGERRP